MKGIVTSSLTLIGGSVAWGLLTLNSITKEVPLGSLEGQILLQESGKPLANKRIELWPVNMEGDAYRARFVRTDSEGRFKFSRLAATSYRLETNAKAHNFEGLTLTVEEGVLAKKEIHAKPVAPYLDMYASRHHFAPASQPVFTLDAFLPDSSLVVKAYKLDLHKVLKEGSLYNALAPLARRDKTPVNPETMGVLAKTWTPEQLAPNSEGVLTTTFKADGLGEGLYWMVAKDVKGKLSTGTWFAVSKIGLIAKTAKGGSLAYVADLDTGEPVAGANVGLVVNGDFQVKGTSDSKGLASLPTPSEKPLYMASMGDSVAFVDSYASDEGDQDGVTLVTYTDRTIYRPGDTIYFKGIVRKRTREGLQRVEPKPVDVEFLDINGDKVASTQCSVTPFGTFSGQFVTSKEDPTGSWRITAKRGDAVQETYVSVAAYRKPNFKIEVTPDRPAYRRGDRARMNVQVEYFFGGPVPNAEVSATIYRRQEWSDPEYAEMFDEGYSDDSWSGEYLSEIKVKTDSFGRAAVDFDTRLEGDSAEVDADYVYTAEVSVAGPDDQYFDGKGSVRVTRGNFRVEIESDSYSVPTGTDYPATVKVVDNDGKPVANVSLTGTWGETAWDGDSEKYLASTAVQATTDASGIAHLQLKTPTDGDYRLEIGAADQGGSRIVDRRWVWVSGDSQADISHWANLEAILDKKRYATGDTAHLTLRSDKDGGSVLVTLESDHIHQSYVVPVKNGVGTLAIPVTQDLAPNVMVSAARLRDFQFSQTEATLKVEQTWRTVQVEVKPDKDAYLPGEQVRYEISTKNASGAPISAEVSLGVVDESIYSLAPDSFDLMKELYPARWSTVRTNFSIPDLYLDGGDKAPSNIQVRRLFKDTAYWNPNITTDSSGKASVAVTLPDNLTQWRATVRAITGQSEAGTGKSVVTARKDLMVRLECPMFLTDGDTQTLHVMLSNRTGKDAAVKVQLESTGGTVLDKTDVQTVQVKSDGEGEIQVPLKAGRPVPGKLTAKAWIEGGATDGVERIVPIQPYGRTYLSNGSGTLAGKGAFDVTTREGANPDVGRLRLTLTPSLGMVLLGPLDDLIGFPYGCVEQTLSRFVPALVVTQALKSGGFPKPHKADQLPAITTDGLARLYRMQHSDGGWGWWEQDASDPFMTAMVLDGLMEAKAVGIPIRETALQNGRKWATEYLGNVNKLQGPYPPEMASLLYLMRATVRAGNSEVSVLLNTSPYFAESKITKPTELAELVRIRKMLGADVSSLYAKLKASGTQGGGFHFESAEYWGEETNARCLAAMLEVNPSDPDINSLIQYLIMKRKGSWWYSTRDTNFALLALAKRMAVEKESPPTGSISVRVNGVELQRVVLDSSGSQLFTDLPLSQLKSGSNRIELERTPPGPIYYSYDYRQVVAQEEPAELTNTSGLKLKRTYHRMSSIRRPDGSWAFEAEPNPITSAKSGEIIEVELTLESPKHLQFLMVEDPIPSGCRVTDSADVETWSWWFDNIDVRDDRVAVFVRDFGSASTDRVIRYRMRAESPGICLVRPATAAEMYSPQDMASTAGGKFEVLPK